MRGNLSGSVTDPHEAPGKIPDRCPRCLDQAIAWAFIGTGVDGRHRYLCTACVEELKDAREPANLRLIALEELGGCE